MKNLTYKLSLILAFFVAVPMLVNAGGTTEFEVDGLKIIHTKSPKEVISVRLFVRGGTANYSVGQDGVEAMAFHLAANGGTTSKEKTAFLTELEQIGAGIGSGSTYDYGHISLNCIKMFWDESWDLFADAILNPAFTQEEFDLEKEKMIAGARQATANPDAHLRTLAAGSAFKGKNYAKVADGTPETLEALSLGDIKKHWEKVVGKERAFLVVVGNVEAADLKAKVKASLANIQSGTPAVPEKQYIIEKGTVEVEDRDIETNYIRGLMSAPRMGTEDYAPMRVSMGILRDIYFEELRTKRSLTYAPGAFYSAGVLGSPYNGLYISTQKPKESLEVMVNLIDSLKTNGFGDKKLRDKKGTFLTYHYMELETSSSQSMSIGNAEIAGDWRYRENFTNEVNNITTSQLNKVFDKYTNAISWAYLGKKADVAETDFKQTKTGTKVNRPY